MRILLLLLWLILGFVYWFIWDKQQKFCCETGAKTEVTGVPAEQKTPAALYPIQFKWADKQAETTTLFSTYKDSLISLLEGGGLLEITGFYQESELDRYPDGTDLGLLRAKAIKEELFPELKEGQFKLNSKLSERGLVESSEPFLSSVIEYKEPGSATLGNRTVYFPFSSTDATMDAELEVYLKSLIEWMKATGGNVEIIGHTDNVGSKAINYNWGMQRAEKVKAYLIRNGAPVAGISLKSEGMMNPIASNDTEEGRAKNRRAEINIIQK